MNKLVQKICNYLIVYFGVFILLILIKPHLENLVKSQENFSTLYLRGYPFDKKDPMLSQQHLQDKDNSCNDRQIRDELDSDVLQPIQGEDEVEEEDSLANVRSRSDPSTVKGNCLQSGSYAGVDYKQDPMFIMANNKHSFSCCPSTYSTDKGCVCLTDQQKLDINNRTLRNRSDL